MRDEIQHRSITSTPLKVSKGKELRTKLFKSLNTACNDRVLITKLEEIHKLLKMTYPDQGKTEIVGENRNFKRTRNVPHFERVDGCWFDFSILVDETPKPALGVV